MTTINVIIPIMHRVGKISEGHMHYVNLMYAQIKGFNQVGCVCESRYMCVKE